MIATYNIQAVTFDKNSICLQVDGKEITIAIDKVSKKLASANEIQRNLFNTSPFGYGIHWPLIDEDLFIDALLKVAS